MKKEYKLAANYNTVTITDITEQDLFEVADWETEVEMDENYNEKLIVAEEILIARMLQREYDLIAGIKVVPPQPMKTVATSKPAEEEPPFEKPSEKQISWARSLGMKDPEKASKQQVWAYIQDHK